MWSSKSRVKLTKVIMKTDVHCLVSGDELSPNKELHRTMTVQHNSEMILFFWCKTFWLTENLIRDKTFLTHCFCLNSTKYFSKYKYLLIIHTNRTQRVLAQRPSDQLGDNNLKGKSEFLPFASHFIHTNTSSALWLHLHTTICTIFWRNDKFTNFIGEIVLNCCRYKTIKAS